MISSICSLRSRPLLIFLMSMTTLGIFWVGQQTQLKHFARADRSLAWIHIAFLGVLCLVPFSTSLLAEFIEYRTALGVYWFNILLLGGALLWSWRYATRNHLLSEDLPGGMHPAVVRRIVIAQTLYACGVALCFLNTYYCIAVVVTCAAELCDRATILLERFFAARAEGHQRPIPQYAQFASTGAFE